VTELVADGATGRRRYEILCIVPRSEFAGTGNRPFFLLSTRTQSDDDHAEGIGTPYLGVECQYQVYLREHTIMSEKGQHSTKTLIKEGADIYVQDTYGYTVLHRMASNDLPVGGEALVRAGHDPNNPMPGADSTPIEIARRSRAIQFLMKMQELGHYETWSL
jgi:hypothetical protein